MKKQFFRVKQLADQTFSRVGKTEALSDDLVAAEKRVDFLKNVCHSISKKLSSNLLGTGQDAQARDKRLKKCPEYIFALTLLDCGTGDEDDLLKHILVECSKVQMCLANTTADFDARIESIVLNPLQHILEVDLPNIAKQKRYLNKLILDMDSARNRYQTAMKHNFASNTGGTSAGGVSSVASKAESIKDELEEVETKVEQNRDTLASEMFQMISRESEIATVLLEYIRLQQSYHRTALTLLDEMAPELQACIADSCIKPMFGTALEEHLRVTRRKIAYPLELCVCALLELGMEEEGLFRVAGGASKVRRMILSIDANCLNLDNVFDYRDVHVIASVFKTYLRKLPEPLLTHELYEYWMNAIRVNSTDETRLPALWNVLHNLPQANYDNLRYVIKFLSLLTKNQESNKMSHQNLAIVMAPNLLWGPDEESANMGMNMNATSQHTIIVETLLKHSDWFFPGEEEFYLTFECPSNRLEVEQSGTPVGSPLKRSQSVTSLTDITDNIHISSASPESPKPITRTRKNKPAPTPPSINIKSNAGSSDHKNAEVADKSGAVASLSAADVSGGCGNGTSRPVKTRNTLEDCQPDNVVLRKPIIPEKPASLQRPLSHSFRMIRPDLGFGSIEKSPTERKSLESAACLERTHVYSMDKVQQVSIVRVPSRQSSSSSITDISGSSTSSGGATFVGTTSAGAALVVSPSSATFVGTASAGTSLAGAAVVSSPSSGGARLLSSPTSARAAFSGATSPTSPLPISATTLAVPVDEENFGALSVADVFPATNETKKSHSSHNRTRSEGHTIDLGSHNVRSHPKNIQRPVPPPPPPPIKKEAESTDL